MHEDVVHPLQAHGGRQLDHHPATQQTDAHLQQHHDGERQSQDHQQFAVG